jgi:glycosyltransferase involved in cell wall biosynthesis
MAGFRNAENWPFSAYFLQEQFIILSVFDAGAMSNGLLHVTDSLDFSVIIPAYNRPALLRRCLQSLVQQNYPKSHFEVIVVDDGSEPPLPDSIRTEFTQIGVILLRHSQNLGPAAARNYGAESARGQYLAFIDDDCLADANWLAKVKAVLTTSASSAFGGPIFEGGNNLYSAASHAILDAVYKYYNSSATGPRFFACGNLIVPAKEYRNLGGFLPEFRASEDREFCARWLQHGHRLIFAPEAIVIHQSHSRLRPFLQCHYNYGRGAYQFRAMQAKLLNRRLKLEPSIFYWRLVRHPLSIRAGLRGIGIAMLAVLAQIASLAGFLAEKRKAKHASA